MIHYTIRLHHDANFVSHSEIYKFCHFFKAKKNEIYNHFGISKHIAVSLRMLYRHEMYIVSVINFIELNKFCRGNYIYTAILIKHFENFKDPKYLSVYNILNIYNTFLLFVIVFCNTIIGIKYFLSLLYFYKEKK